MNKKGALFGSLLSCFLLVGCASNDKPSTDNNSSDKTTEESTITKVNPTAVALTGNNFVTVGGNLRLLPKFTPDNTTEKDLLWESSDDTKATVDENGLITGVASGDVVISATSSVDSNVKVTHNVKVVVAPSKITIANSKHVNLLVNGTEQLDYTVTGKEGFNNEVEIIIEKPEVVSVSSEGLITAKGLGQSEITVKSKYSDKSATITIHVGQAPESIHLFANDDWESRTALTEPQALDVGQVVDYGIQYNGENSYYGATAESNNLDVATVELNGNNKIKVSAKSAGTAKITVKSVVDKSKFVELTVNVAAKEIVYPTEGLVMEFGEKVAPGKHSDSGTKITDNGSFDAGEYTIPVTNATNIYVGCKDAQGNKALKIGKSDAVGTFTMTVDEKVNQVIIKGANYKGRASTLDVNGTKYTFTGSTNDGAYDAIVIDTSTTKELVISSVSTKYDSKDNFVCFIDSITLKTQKIEAAPVEPQA